jgi:hypothetical protein
MQKDAANLHELFSIPPAAYSPAALCLLGNSHVPAIVCEDEAAEKCLFILARASRQMDPLEAAEEADADLASTPGSGFGEVGPDCLRSLYKLGYRIMPGLKVEDVELLEDLLEDEAIEDEEQFETIEVLYYTAEQQIRSEEPPEVRGTLVRLRRAGYSRSQVMEMIVHVMMHESAKVTPENPEVNIPCYVSALLRLPHLDCEDEQLHD